MGRFWTVTDAKDWVEVKLQRDVRIARKDRMRICAAAACDERTLARLLKGQRLHIDKAAALLEAMLEGGYIDKAALPADARYE